MSVEQQDKKILRDLARQVADIAARPIHDETRQRWKRLNSLQPGKPLVLVLRTQIPWHEMAFGDELTVRTSAPWARSVEMQLRQTVYEWKHMPWDMVVEPIVRSPLAIRDSGFGISADEQIVKTDTCNSVVSHHYHAQIQSAEDLLKIHTPKVTHDAAASENEYQRYRDVFDGILKIEKGAPIDFWFAPWDDLVQWWGVQEALMDLILKPELVHKAMDHFVRAWLARLDQYETLGLLRANNNSQTIGSGGYGYSDELPQPADSQPVGPTHLWGSAAAQIFSDVSPAMHAEFALQYELRWLKRFDLTYYGCCDPLHRKVDMLSAIPNLRKVSMSPWTKADEAAANVGRRYVYSYKPNPAVFATDTFNIDVARAELTNVLRHTRTHSCVVEIILKDVSTIRYEPQRLWAWSEMAQALSREFA